MDENEAARDKLTACTMTLCITCNFQKSQQKFC